MPYDSKGRWVPPDDSESDWQRLATYEFEDLIESGALAEYELADMAAVESKFDTEDWARLDNNDRLEVLKEYQRIYEYMSDGTRLDDQWGMDLERLEDSDLWEDDGDLDINGWFENHLNRSGDGHKIDYGNYNDDHLYQAARNSMIQGTPEQQAAWGGGDYNDPYENAKQIRTATDIISGWDDAKRKEMVAWAQENVKTLSDAERHLTMFQQAQKFDPVTKTMYTYEPIRKDGAIDPNNPSHNALTIKQHLPLAPPKELNVVKGNAPAPTVNADGNRIANEADITGWYRQYLNRDPDQAGLDHWLDDVSNGKSFEWIQGQIMNSPEAHGLGNKDFGSTYYNPEAYGSEASITSKLVAEPAKVQAPNITIRNIGEPKKPTRSYMALNDTVWTDPSVDTRSKNTGKPRKNAEFLTKAPVKGGT